MAHTITERAWGTTKDGLPVTLYTLVNASGMILEATNYGARAVRVVTPDATGKMDDIILGFDTLSAYEEDTTYQGATVGRYGNRIGNGGRFTLDGVTYQLPLNNAPSGIPCALHGGLKGFSARVWNGSPVVESSRVGVRFGLSSPDGDEGYPGKVDVSVTFWLTDDNTWRIEYFARTDKATHLNLTQHAYWNLNGAFRGDILSHRLTIDADTMTPYDAGMIPTGEISPVAGTPFDFTTPRALASSDFMDNALIRFGNGYDHNWVLRSKGEALCHAATLHSTQTGRTVDVWTSEPGLQVYDGSYLPAGTPGKAGGVFAPRAGVALETQHFPDTPNKPEFPTTCVLPGETYATTTEYRFSVH